MPECLDQAPSTLSSKKIVIKLMTRSHPSNATCMAARWLVMGRHVVLSVYVDDIKLAGRKESLALMDMLGGKIELEDPTPLVNQVYSGCIQREAVTRDEIVKGNRDSFGKDSPPKPGGCFLDL